jgi:ribose-phosphate pyrophosphokinase
VVATHGVLPGDASTRLAEKPYIKEVVITDTVPLPADKVNSKIKVISIAPLLGEAIRRIHEGRSVGELFTLQSG